MRIAYLTPVGTVGGAEMVLLDLLAALPSAAPGAEALVIVGDEGPLRAEVEALGIRCEVLPLPSGVARLGDAGVRGLAGAAGLVGRGLAAVGSTWSYRGRLADRLRRFEVGLVQTNGMKMHLLGTSAAPGGVPVVWHLHDYLTPRAAMARLLRLAARRPRVEAVAISRAVADDARSALPGSVPIRTIHNAVDLDRFHDGPGDGPDLDRAAGLPEAPTGTVRVGLVATFASWKGHGLFLEAAARVPAGPPIRFYIVGGPIYRTAGSQVDIGSLRATADRLGLSGRVGFTGHLADPAAALRALDVVVHASTRPEPFGRVIVEGMASGRAVIAMAEGGAAELFEDGADAIGCPPRDPAMLASAIARVATDEGLRRRLGAAGRRSAEARFDRTRLATDWAPVYDRAGPGAAAGAAVAGPGEAGIASRGSHR